MSIPTNLPEAKHTPNINPLPETGEPQNNDLKVKLDQVKGRVEVLEQKLQKKKAALEEEEKKLADLTRQIEELTAENKNLSHKKVDCCKTMCWGLIGTTLVASSALAFDFYVQYQEWALAQQEGN